jgi:hypothetical protein
MRSRGNYYKAFTLDAKPPYVEVTFPQLTGADTRQEQNLSDHEVKE